MDAFNFLKGIKWNRNNILVAIAVIAVIVTGVLIFTQNNKSFSVSSFLGMGLSDQQIADRVIRYINENDLSASPASLVSFSSESGLVKVKLEISGNEYDSYASKDGKLMFPQAFDMSEMDDDDSGEDGGSTTVQKTDDPILEAYVVSRCPYGLQMQRAMAEAVSENPELASYMEVRYMGSVSGNTITSMHGDEEAQENLRQICIREEQPAKYWSYVACQMKAADTEKSCEYSTGVDSAKLSACVSDSSRGIAYASEDFDLNDQYGITGSPTLVLNGTVIDGSGRSANGVKSDICSGFSTEADFCSSVLNTAAAAVSFSSTYASASGDADSSAGCE